MGHPAYEARREAEKAIAEREKAAAEASRETWESLTALMTGRACLQISPALAAGGPGWSIRIVRG